MDTTYIYNPTTDTLYLMLYILGASRHEIWFALEYPNLIKQIQEKPTNNPFSKNKRTFSQSNDSNTTNQTINCKALKVYKKCYSKYAEREYATKELLIKNNQKCPQLIYPHDKFNATVDKKEYTVIVYDVMFSSLHDVIKQYTENNPDRTISPLIVSKIIPQIVDATNFMHSCGYMHTDIKLKNILIQGVSQLTNDIMNYAKNYNLVGKFSRNINKNNVCLMITKIVDTFVDDICKKFGLEDKLGNDESDNDSSDVDSNDDDNDDNSNDNSSNDNSNNNDSNDTDGNNNSYSDESSIIESEDPDMKTHEYDENGSYSDSFNSYNSGGQMYNEIYDPFHTKYVVKKLRERINNENNIFDDLNGYNNGNKDDSKKLTTIQKKRFEEAKLILETPIIKLADFDNIEKCSYKNRTIQNRPFRAPEVVLGLDYNEKIDHWSIGILILTMLLGKPFVDASKENMAETHDLDFITIKLFLEKICYTKEQQTKLLELVKLSLRTGYFLNEDNKTLKFLTKLDFDYWINYVDDKKIIAFLNGCLDMNADCRKLVW